MATMLPTIGQQNQAAQQAAYIQQQQQYAAQHGLAIPSASAVDDNACCGCSGETCACLNKFFMFLAALLALGGAVLVWIGGIAPYNLSFQTALQDCPNAGGSDCFGLTKFISCNDQYRQVWSNPSANNMSFYPYTSGRYSNPNLQYLAWARCAAPQSPMVLLSAFTGFMIIWLGVSGVYAVFSHSRTAAFSSGISIGWTTALIIVNLCVSMMSFAPTASMFMDCVDFKGNDFSDFSNLKGYCLSGTQGVPQGPPKQTIMNWGMAVACFYVGSALTLLCLMLLKYTTTNVFHRGTREKAVATFV